MYHQSLPLILFCDSPRFHLRLPIPLHKTKRSKLRLKHISFLRDCGSRCHTTCLKRYCVTFLFAQILILQTLLFGDDFFVENFCKFFPKLYASASPYGQAKFWAKFKEVTETQIAAAPAIYCTRAANLLAGIAKVSVPVRSVDQIVSSNVYIRFQSHSSSICSTRLPSRLLLPPKPDHI